MEMNKINELLGGIGTLNSIHQISLNDYPSSNHIAQAIAERVNAIMFSLEEFKGYVKDDGLDNCIKTVWSRKLSEQELLISTIKELNLAEQIKAAPNTIAKLKDLLTNEPKDTDKKKEIEYLKGKIDEFEKIVNKAFELFECTFKLI